MKKISLLGFIAALIPLTTLASNHHFELSTANSNLTWEEFAEGREKSINREDGSLSSLALGYSFQQNDNRIDLNLSTSKGTVDYLGEKKNSIDDVKYPTTTDYHINEYELLFGKYYSTDFITPFAYINGGYQDRERTINPFPNSSNRTAEHYTFYFWGIGLDAEIFNWNNISINSGLYFKNYVMGEVESVDAGFSKPLEQLKITGFKFGVSYSFLKHYKTSLMYLTESGSMPRSNDYIYTEIINGVEATKTSTQPESDQKIDEVKLSVAFVF